MECVKTGVDLGSNFIVPSSYSTGCLRIEVFRAKGLKNTRTFGVQSPYVKALMLPTNTHQQTAYVNSGDIAPVWTDEHSNVLEFDLTKGIPPHTVALTVWASENISDDLIGRCIIALPTTKNSAGGMWLGKEMWYNVDTGGSLLCKISHKTRAAKSKNDKGSVAADNNNSNNYSTHSKVAVGSGGGETTPSNSPRRRKKKGDRRRAGTKRTRSSAYFFVVEVHQAKDLPEEPKNPFIVASLLQSTESVARY